MNQYSPSLLSTTTIRSRLFHIRPHHTGTNNMYLHTLFLEFFPTLYLQWQHIDHLFHRSGVQLGEILQVDRPRYLEQLSW